MPDPAAPQGLSPEHLRTLYEITGAMNSSLEFDEVLNNVMDSVMALTKAQRGFLMIAGDDGELRVLVSKGLDDQTIEREGFSTTVVRQVVETRQPLLTNNAQFDDRYQASESIILRGLRAILCAPMLVKGRLVGVVYVDSAMRAGSFSSADLELLNAVAGQAGIALENARLYAVAVEKGRMERELQMASEIQQALLPQHMPEVPGYEVAALWRAARETAGDFYDAFCLDDDRFAVVIGDVSDKGAPAALFMAVVRTMIRSTAHAGLSPLNAIQRTNDLLLQDADSGMFVTVYHSHFEAGGHSIHVNGGHNPPIFFRRIDHVVEDLPRGGRALGWFPDLPLQAVEISLTPGDVIVYYTDGLIEAEDEQRQPYGLRRLKRALQRNAHLPPQELLDAIMQDVDAFRDGVAPFDDITVVVVRFTGSQVRR
ncbi:MAG: PP2C family protein-serine/threonine phosphatase [Phototrophicaceae bacterium]